MRRLLTVGTVIFLAIEASPSAQRALTRPAAQQAIAANNAFASASALALCDPANTVKAGVREGLWTEQGFGGVAITPGGQRLFSSVEGFPDYKAHLVAPAKRSIVAVTGITDNGPGGNEKLVLFTWRYSGLPEVVSRYACQGEQPHEGQARLRLFDDGWRVQNVELPENHRVAFAGVSAAVAKSETDAASRKVQADRLSRAAASTIGTFSFGVRGRNPNGPYQTTYRLQITDVSVVCLGNRTAWGEKEVWFGDIDRVELRSTIIDGGGPQVPQLLVWHRDGFTYSSPLINVEQNVGNLGDLPNAQRVLAQALTSWRRWYADMLSGAAPLSPRGAADNGPAKPGAADGSPKAIHDAMMYGRIGDIQQLLRSGVGPNYAIDEYYTLLGAAAYNGQLEIVKMLLQAGADPNLTPKGGASYAPLRLALLQNHPDVAAVLRAAGAR